ncbi:MAG: DUF1801 domain-containing protein [Chryseolinea sp.]
MSISKKPNRKSKLSGEDVSGFLDELNLPLRKVIDQLRRIIVSASELEENIKWNGPNYAHEGEDRITMRIHPATQVQLIFHRGAASQEQPTSHLIDDNSGMLTWKTNDRAVATFRSEMEVTKRKSALTRIVKEWIEASSV